MSRPGGYNATSSPLAYDYGLVHLDDDLGNGLWMAMSAESDASIEAKTQRTVGSPEFHAGTCSENFSASGGIYSGYPVYWAYRETSGIVYSPSGWFGTRLDATVGQSGSGVWYFPGSTNLHWISMVISRWKTTATNGYIAGPKAPDFRSWVIANMM